VTVSQQGIEEVVRTHGAPRAVDFYHYGCCASCPHHPNIIRLVGFTLPPPTPSGQPRLDDAQGAKKTCLVYEFAARGGVQNVLKDNVQAAELTWFHRVKIALGVAKGLAYMHHRDHARPAFHRDIKAANIALTNGLVPKIIDCGLAKYVPEHDANSSKVGASIHTMTGARFGTIGYMCEKYCKRADMNFDSKCEIFSVGIFLLELFSGQLQGSNTDCNLEDMLDDDEEPLLPDARAGQWPTEAARQFLVLASECVVKHAKRRSDMRSVVQTLSRVVGLHQTSALESSLLRTQEQLVAENERLVLQQDVAERLSQESTHTCVVCVRTFPHSGGVMCAKQPAHFLCAEDFSDMIISQCSDMGQFIKVGCHIVCPMCLAVPVPRGEVQLETHLTLSTLKTHASEESFACFMAACLRADRDLEDRKVGAERARDQERHMDELQALRNELLVDKVAASAQRHRHRIINDILTLKCPHCSVAVFNFTACFAVQHTADDDDFAGPR